MMLKDLLTPEAQADAYVWASVMLAHGCIGAVELDGQLQPATLKGSSFK